jgi:hypothetical protein
MKTLCITVSALVLAAWIALAISGIGQFKDAADCTGQLNGQGLRHD